MNRIALYSVLLLSLACPLASVGQAPVQSPAQPTAPQQPNAALPVGQQPVDSPTQPTAPQEPEAGSPVSLAFCKNDPRPEVKYFCPWLSAVLAGAQAHQSAAQMRPLLKRLNPGDTHAISMLISAISTQMAIKGAVSGIQQAGQSRPDQQLGSSSNASGTTSLVTKAGSAELLALAIDTGALTQSVNGSTATVNSNADQLYRLVTGHNSGCIINCGSGGGKVGAFENHVLNPLNLTASFALAQTSSTTTPTSGQASGVTPSGVTMASIPTGAGKLTNITAKYQLLNKYDPRGSDFQTAWKKQVLLLAPSGITLGDDTQAVFVLLEADPSFSAATKSDTYQQQLVAKANADPSGVQLVEEFEVLWAAATNSALQIPALPAAVAAVMKDRSVYRTAWSNAIAQAAGVLLTVQYSFNKTLNQPQTHDITGVYGYSFGNSETLTVNGAVSIYNGTLPAGATYGRIHYGQISGEYDRNLSSPTSSVQEQLSLAGYWQYQPSPSILNIPAGTVAPGTNIPLPNGTQEFVGTAGSLWVTQAKVTIKGAGGINIPIGVSWSNKTDLLQGNKVGAQVGISYNFSSLGRLF